MYPLSEIGLTRAYIISRLTGPEFRGDTQEWIKEAWTLSMSDRSKFTLDELQLLAQVMFSAGEEAALDHHEDYPLDNIRLYNYRRMSERYDRALARIKELRGKD